MPLKHLPLPEQRLRQLRSAQSAPSHQCSHLHSPVLWLHVPWPEHAHGHSFLPQSGPKRPLAHEHVPLRHVPAPEQPPGHSGVSHAGPPQPSSQLHASVSSAHVPWPEQSFGQPATAHASPR